MKIIITMFLLLSGLCTSAQSEEQLKMLFDKKWIITTYEIGGQQFPATNVGQDDCTAFYADHTVKSVDHGATTLSKWKYDTAKNSMTLYSEKVTVRTEMKIFSLTEKEFIWETTNPEGMTMTIRMVSSPNK